MGKHLSLYQTEDEYNNNKDTHLTPNVSLIVNPIEQIIFIPETKSDTFTFIIDDVEYQAEEGMTWEQWINSKYNTNGFYIYEKYNYEYIAFSNGDTVISTNGAGVFSTEIVKPINYGRHIYNDDELGN